VIFGDFLPKRDGATFNLTPDAIKETVFSASL
jgi:hypothetical protein